MVPVKVPPPSVETLSRMSLLQAPGVLTPVYSPAMPDFTVPVGTQPLASLECALT